ncbi:hypothetical protein K505DRAFT_157248 [Melanomma pulvis-pyrius CBS 109.77]|uniref:Zn(2)-C6 fungal-type domain-containing protein n=1 Tax=Melanomma pulvis-pyrius CBS 109.77 TaxID=1314802 RepID=A0A6A6XJR4_9PLEO|nr:hypothetical protein K505DRAFT_157248 [Melanomma pulvis-pyrius CBS 109.77]
MKRSTMDRETMSASSAIPNTTVDILRRHYKTCKSRGDHPVPGPQKRGRRKQACDRCATFKMACDRSRPCYACLSNNTACTWNRVQATVVNTQIITDERQRNDTALSVTPYSPESSPSESNVAAPPQSPESLSVVETPGFMLEKMPIPFLMNFVTSESRSLPETFGYSNVAPEPLPKLLSPGANARRSSWLLTEGATMPVPTYSGGASNNSILDELPIMSDILSQRPHISAMEPQASYGGVPTYENPPPRDSHPADGISHSLELMEHPSIPSDASISTNTRISELVMQLASIYITLPKGHPARASNVRMEDIDEFLTTSKIRTVSQTYFHHFYSHLPILHRPSFNVETTSLRLVLVVYLGGALFSSLDDLIHMARSFLDLAEEYIFQDPFFEQLSKWDSQREPVQDCDSNIQAVQAALNIIFLQNWEGNNQARRRIRAERFSSVVMGSRAMQLTSACNPLFIQIQEGQSTLFSWHKFIKYEERLRLMYYIFILDSIFCIFHNYTPRLALAELSTEIPCWIEAFSATSSAECFQIACDQKHLRPLSLRKLVKLFMCEEPPSQETQNLLKGLRTLELFLIVNALHTIIWTTRTSLLGSFLLVPIEQALNRWEILWESHMSSTSARHFKRLGFVKNAIEFWWLAKLLIHATTVMSLDQNSGDGTCYADGENRDPGNGVAVAAVRPCDNDMVYISRLMGLFSSRGSLHHR